MIPFGDDREQDILNSDKIDDAARLRVEGTFYAYAHAKIVSVNRLCRQIALSVSEGNRVRRVKM